MVAPLGIGSGTPAAENVDPSGTIYCASAGPLLSSPAIVAAEQSSARRR
jgi:hypothetical protein